VCSAPPWTSMPPVHTHSTPHTKPQHGHRGRYAYLEIRAAAGTRANRCMGVCHVLPAQTPRSGDSLSSEADTWASCSGEPKVRELWFGLKVGARQRGSTCAVSLSDGLSDAVMGPVVCQADGRGSLPVGQSWRVVLEATRRDWVEPELVWNAQLRHELAQGLAAEVGPAAPFTCPHRPFEVRPLTCVSLTGFRSTSWTM
jgi:hypothetical protein